MFTYVTYVTAGHMHGGAKIALRTALVGGGACWVAAERPESHLANT